MELAWNEFVDKILLKAISKEEIMAFKETFCMYKDMSKAHCQARASLSVLTENFKFHRDLGCAMKTR